jgi:glucose-1-phosphate adenylyltransferase
MTYPKILALVLAGGKGERLFPLTAFRSKPSVPFGGRYRIVDFVISNLINSKIYSIYLFVQYKSQSLIEHIRQNWVLSSCVKDHFVTVVPPQMRLGPEWFQGTSDAVFQNLNLIQRHDPDLVLAFGSDHIYRMDIRQMIDFHLKKEAHVTVAARPVPVEKASDFGVIISDGERRIVGFQEKPEKPIPMPDNPDQAYASMGNYLFNKETLLQALMNARKKRQHDFGAHILPSLVENEKEKVYAYDFATNDIPGTKAHEEKGYWRDVGTIKAFFDAHMDLLGESSPFELNNTLWTIYPSEYSGPGAKIINATIENSLISEGVTIRNASIKNSIIRREVTIEDDVSIENCIIMDQAVIKRGANLRYMIIDKQNVINENEKIGFDSELDRFRCHIDPSGIGIIPKGGKPIKLPKK